MSYHLTQMTSRVSVVACCLVMMAAATCHAALPEDVDSPPAIDRDGRIADAEMAHDELIERMLTPIAEIRLGPGRANQERLMRRSSSFELSYTIRSLWAGIVEYVFPPHGLFRRDAPLARVYDPALLSDLERARERMAAEDVSRVTIAAPVRRVPDDPSEPAEADDTGDVGDDLPSPAPAPAPARQQTAPQPVPPPVSIPEFDFEANQTEQAQLREQAELAATAIPEAIDQCSDALAALSAAEEELAQRHRLLEQGVLAEEALRPAEERAGELKAAYNRAEAVLDEAQQGYERIAARIAALEAEAEAAHEAIKVAREARAARAEALARREEAEAGHREAATEVSQNPPEVRLQERDPRPEQQNADEEPMAGGGELPTEPEEAVRVYHTPEEMLHVAAPRWEELNAEAPGLISEVLANEGEAVEAGDDLLRVANLQLAAVNARVDVSDLRHFTIGRSVTIGFKEYDGSVFSGWVDDVTPIPGTDEADVKLLLVCQSGRFANDPYLALRWMTLEAGVGREKIPSEALEPAKRARAGAQTEVQLAQMFPTVAPGSLYASRANEPTERVDDHFTGRLRLQPMERLTASDSEGDDGTDRLAALWEWRKTYIDGMTTTLLDDGTCISYPADGDASTAVRLMLEGGVSHRPNLCAATMREALGWGLGDAHQWATRLPRVGYVPREDGLPRPGDILVWPFTYGPNRTQHIGFAVRQGRKLMLLSNLSGTLGTTEILGGYIAFYKPADQPAS
ncbi:MAG: efflux RND transporter periplasmic adaptor subunit [Armatimonadota bacterium]